jgi:PhnB protein
MDTKSIPEGYSTVTPFLAVDDATSAIDYYKRAFGATERVRMDTTDGKVGHAALQIGDSMIMLSDPMGEGVVRSPKALGGTTASVFLYVDDVDDVVRQAVEAGAKVETEVADQFWGDRFGTIVDPFGHHWSVATHIEDLTPEEIGERARTAMAAAGART